MLHHPIPALRPAPRTTALPRCESVADMRFRRGLLWVAILTWALWLGAGCAVPEREAAPEDEVGCVEVAPRFIRCLDETHGIACYRQRGVAALSCVRVEPMPIDSLGRVPLKVLETGR